MTAHRTLTDPEIHEPKGASTAIANAAYFATGGGSGSWRKPYFMGWEDIADDGTSQTLTSGSFVDLTNDGTGATSLSTYRLPGAGAIWDTSTNAFQWDVGGAALGDTVDLRIDMTVTTAATNRDVTLAIDMAHGHGSEFQLVINNWHFKSAAAYKVTGFISLYMGSATVLEEPAKVAVKTDGAGDSLVLSGFFVRVLKRNPVLHTS